MPNITFLKRIVAAVYWNSRIGPLRHRLSVRARYSTRNQSGAINIHGFHLEYSDLPSFYIEFKDIFWKRIYHFNSTVSDPFIIDGGGCLGVASLYFKHVYPRARIICFEPDLNMLDILRRNLTSNSIDGVNVLPLGLSGNNGVASFAPDGSDGGRIIEDDDASIKINTVKLSDWIDGSVDFVKLNIEGEELDVLEDLETTQQIKLVREFAIEYHGWANGQQRLGQILDLLDRNGFRYLVHDFDSETCAVTKPPFKIPEVMPWFCLIYAKRI